VKHFSSLILLLMLPLMVACKVLPQGAEPPPKDTQSQAAIDQTRVTEGQADGAKVRPKPRPANLDANADPAASLKSTAPIEQPTPESTPQKSNERLACEKRGGTWGNAGSAKVQSCIKRTRDAGKQCRKAGDCESACLARSGTCAPVKPLFGCNDILQKDGSRVTLCID
jgi:hypothetical protein